MTFNSSKLSNGLNVVSFQMPYTKTVAINVLVKVGSRYELPEEAGISHFLEHMAFKGTSNRSAQDIAKEFDAIGGHFNAYTSREQTVYYTKVLTEYFSKAIDILADIIQNSVFNHQDIVKELGVILQEIAGVEDCPDGLVYENFYNKAYNGSAFGKSVLGYSKNLLRFKKSDFKKYLAKHYIAENIIISVAGNIKHQAIIKTLEKVFTKVTQGSASSPEPAIYKGGYVYAEKKELEQTTIALGFESVPYANLLEFYRAQILAIIFGGGLSSRLFQRIREELALVYSIGSYNSSYLDSGIFSIYAACEHKNVNILLDNLIIEIQKIQDLILDEELLRAKNQIRANIFMAEERSEYKSEEIAKNFGLFGKYFPASEAMEMIMQTTKNQLIDTARQIFTTKSTLSIVGTNVDSKIFDKITRLLGDKPL